MQFIQENLGSLERKQTLFLIPSLLRGFIATFGAGLGGFNTAFKKIATPQFEFTKSELYWLGNVLAVGATIGALLSIFTIDRFGRRTTFIFGLLSYLFAWSCLYFSPSVKVILLGRLFGGVGRGVLGMTGQIYGCECLYFDRPLLRESFKIWSGVLASFFMIAFEPFRHYMSYRDMASLSFFVTMAELVLVYVFLPESPAWLQNRGRYAEMERSRKALGVPQSALDDQNVMSVICSPNQRYESFFEKLKRNDVYGPAIATVVLFLLAAFVGAPQVMWAESKDRVLRSAAMMNCLIFGVNVLLAIFIPFVGFKKLVYTGTAGLSVFLVLYAGTFAVNSLIGWREIVRIMIHIFFTIGIFNLYFGLVPYIFPVDAKGLSFIGMIFANVVPSLAMYYHVDLLSALGAWIYLIYAVFNILVVLWVRYCLPEVVGRTQTEIRQFFLREDGIPRANTELSKR